MGMFGKLFGKKEVAGEEKGKNQDGVAEKAVQDREQDNVAVDAAVEEDVAAAQVQEETVVVTDAAKVASQGDGKGKKEHDNFRLKILLKDLKENKTNEVLNMVLDEVVMRTKFISPMQLSRKPELKEDGTAIFTEDTLMRMPMVTSEEGKNYYVMFTGKDEYEQWENMKNIDTILLAFDDFAALMEKNQEAAGVVLNPFSDNLIITRVNMEHLKTQKELRTKGIAVHKVTKDTKVQIGDPKEYPGEMVEAIKRYLPSVQDVNRVWLRLMIKDGNPSLLLVVDQSGVKEVVFRAIAEVAKPYLRKTYIDIVAYQDDFGKKAAEGAEPFYEK